MDNTRRPPRINYPLPLLATLASSLVLLLIALILAYASIGNMLVSFSGQNSEPVLGILCGITTFVMLAGVAFFIVACIKCVRDLATPMQFTTGTVVGLTNKGQDVPSMLPSTASLRRSQLPDEATRRRQSPPFWLVIDPELQAIEERKVEERRVEAESSEPPSTRIIFGSAAAKNEPKPPTAGRQPASAIEEELARKKLLRRFRVDRPVYASLNIGQRVVVAHSRHLEHVYYAQIVDDFGGQTILNKSLL